MQEITEDMVSELNEQFKDTIIEFKLGHSITAVVDIKMKPQYTNIFDSYILNLTAETKRNLQDFFRKYSIHIMFNNTASCFWATTKE